MLRKYENLGAALTAKEMKEVKGGVAAFANSLWECSDGTSTPLYVCRSYNPTTECGYLSCVSIGFCPSPTNCA